MAAKCHCLPHSRTNPLGNMRLPRPPSPVSEPHVLMNVCSPQSVAFPPGLRRRLLPSRLCRPGFTCNLTAQSDFSLLFMSAVRFNGLRPTGPLVSLTRTCRRSPGFGRACCFLSVRGFLSTTQDLHPLAIYLWFAVWPFLPLGNGSRHPVPSRLFAAQ